MSHLSPLAYERVIAGVIQNCSSVILRGRNAAISTTAETVWSAGATYAQLTTAEAFEVVSSSANDAAAGTGARTIQVDLVDGDYTQTSQTVTLNGTTAVAISGTYVACNGARLLTAGSGLVNAGNIDVRTASGDVVKCRIAAAARLGMGESADFLYTIPANYIGILRKIDFSTITLTGDLSVYLDFLNSSGVRKTMGMGQCSMATSGFADGKGSINFGNGISIPEKTLIELRAIVSANAGDLCAMAQLLLIKKGTSNGLGF